MKKVFYSALVLLGTITLTACSVHKDNNNVFAGPSHRCKDIRAQLHTQQSRYLNTSKPMLSATKHRLLQEYHRYGCDAQDS